MRKINKKGSEKYYILISLILGLIVLGIVLYFLFYQYFGEEEINYETCKQSILLRATAPEFLNAVSTKNLFPLKCKTEVINIDYKDTNKAEKEFAEAIVSSWALIGNGYYKITPVKITQIKCPCLVTVRYHLEEDVKEYYRNNPINFKKALYSKFIRETSYMDYLKNNGNPFFRFSSWGNNFSITSCNADYVFGSNIDECKITFPEKLDVDGGDIFIILTVPSEEKMKPAITFFQAKDIGEAHKALIDVSILGIPIGDLKICDYIETVPA